MFYLSVGFGIAELRLQGDVAQEEGRQYEDFHCLAGKWPNEAQIHRFGFGSVLKLLVFSI